VARRMDQRWLIGLEKRACQSRPRLASLVDAIQQWFYFLFYRTLFSSIEEGSVLAVMMLVHVAFEIGVYPLRMWGRFNHWWVGFQETVIERCFGAKFKHSAIGEWLRIHQSLEELQRELCLEYVSRSLSFFSSLASFVFLSLFYQYSSYNGGLYTPFNPDPQAFEKSMLYTGLTCALEIACFVAVICLAHKCIGFKFFAPWVQVARNPIALMVFISAGAHITTDVCIARFKPTCIAT
jgi:hypothetical protein